MTDIEYSERKYAVRARDGIEQLSRRWGWLVALGILLMIAGAVALGSAASIVVATLATVVFLGTVLLIGGVVEVVSAFAALGWRGFGLHLLNGILAAVLGGLLVARPVTGAGVLTLLLALMLLVSGIARIIFAVAERVSGRGWTLLAGIASLALGIMVLARFPTSAFWFLGLVVGVELFSRGVMWLLLGLRIRKLPSELPPLAQAAAPA